jgi:hypothetical protein
MGCGDPESGTNLSTALPQNHEYPLADQVCPNATTLAGSLMYSLFCFDQGQVIKLTFHPFDALIVNKIKS